MSSIVPAHAVATPGSMRAGRAVGPDKASRFLRTAGAVWLGLALFGQLLLAAYVVGFYGRTALAGRFEEWGMVLPKAPSADEPFLAGVLVLHLAFAAVILVGGALQLLPPLRRRWPAFHRIVGRIYLAAAVILSVGGLVLVWVRGTVGDLSQHLGITINALLILGCAAMAWRHARARRIDAHRRWALRLFLVVSGVWFFRVGLMAWIVANGGPAGFDPKTFTGPTLTTLSFAQSLLPLLVLEGFLRAQAGGKSAKVAMGAFLLAATGATLLGIGAATMIMWWPRL